ncbi:hypothetical protein NY08_2191 [Rhodococcus sp. B7740]|uniref:hypothetical protein n=1 Tax=Rhodococcus sp. B7740 TaxID=1564114 RepID=UPI0005D773C5|nr:hypothetical protein [Rhodococcus sp. B7740]AJW40219.1 hypothetical protein NY08_2191 [Rhodococcus sp. B7740]
MSTFTRAATIIVVAAALALGTAPLAQADPAPVSTAFDRQETLIRSSGGVDVSYVSLALPLSAPGVPYPSACDRVGYWRYRPAEGAENSSDADAVVVQQQGLGAGAVHSEPVARNTVLSALDQGKHIEFWSLARRAACLDETAGFDEALRTGNYLDAVDYYFGDKQIDGQTFPGFRRGEDLRALDAMGLPRVVRDQYEVMLHELPDQKVRQSKAICTGISLGGLVTGLFSDWDFDGNRATTADAGYNQCQSFAAQDSMISSDPAALQNTPLLGGLTNLVTGAAAGVLDAGLNTGVVPRTFGEAPVLGTKTFMLLRLAGLAAHLDPNGESRLLQHIPQDAGLELSLNYLFARSAAEFASDVVAPAAIRSYRFTNQALLGVLLDNNSISFSLFQMSLGALGGGPVEEMTFPMPGSVTQVPILGSFLELAAGKQTRVAPTDSNVLYTWRDYRDVRDVPYTSPDHEVTDITKLAEVLSTGSPNGYWETYFPLELLKDIGGAYGGSRTGELSHLATAGMSRTKPNLVLLAGDSPIRKSAGMFFPAPSLAIERQLPGYTHADTIGAAEIQSNGERDYSGQYLAEFISSQIDTE